MLRFLADENLHGAIVSGLLSRRPGLDIVRAQDVGLLGLMIRHFSRGRRNRIDWF